MEKSEYPGDAPGAEGAVAKDDLSERMRSMFPDGIPNIYRMLSRNMRVLTGLVALKEQLAVGELSETERLLVALEVANHSDCGYCQAALTHYCTNDLGVSPDVIAATIKGDLPGDRRLALVTQATRDLIEKRGKLGRAEISRYESLGLSFSQILEIIAVIAEYTLATFASNLDRTRIDPDYRSG